MNKIKKENEKERMKKERTNDRKEGKWKKETAKEGKE